MVPVSRSFNLIPGAAVPPSGLTSPDPHPSPERRCPVPRRILGRRLPVVAEHVTLTVNGVEREAVVEPRRLLVQTIREDLGLTGTHVGCDTSQCGACTVHLDGQAGQVVRGLRRSRPTAHAVKTIEGDGLGRGAPPDPDRVLGEARPAMRLLHSGDDHGRGRSARRATRTRPTTRSATRSRATSAAAPATTTSSRQSARRRPSTAPALPPRRLERVTGGSDDQSTCSAPRSSGSRIPASSPARVAISTTSSCPG